jgi:hypothetical protein
VKPFESAKGIWAKLDCVNEKLFEFEVLWNQYI